MKNGRPERKELLRRNFQVHRMDQAPDRYRR